MQVYLATDHAGFELKEKVKEFLKKEGYEIEDCGAYKYDKDDDYPDFISKAAEKVSKDPTSSVGIIFGGSGQGEEMLANKFENVRCAVFYGPALSKQPVDATGRQSEDPFEIVRLTRLHNHANILSLGARFLTIEEALKAVKLWLGTPYSSEENHVRRVKKIENIE